MDDDTQAMSDPLTESVLEDASGLDFVDVTARTESQAEHDLDESVDSPSGGDPGDDAENDLLSTDRVGTDVLESLFTERTETDEDDEDDVPREMELTGQIVGDACIEESETGDENIQEQQADPAPEVILQIVSRAASPPIDPSPIDQSPLRPPVPARPPRRTVPVETPPPVSPPPPLDHSQSNASLQLVNFDVGGKLFRCKASLICKRPTKRLFHVISCGCEQLTPDTFFIDRNPQHFELVLDWYRTGKCSRPLPPHVNEDALREDARYFDLYEEMFPAPPVIPPRKISSPLPVLPSRHPTPLVSPAPLKIKAELFRFCKREIRSVAPTSPVWFSVRAHEHLVVESIRGEGKLLVRVTDASGLARVFVEQAVLFDSRSWFYRDADGRARLQHCVLPGSHVYSFWMEPVASDRQASPSPPPVKQKTSKGKAPVAPATAATAKPELGVEFRLVSTFSADDQLEDDKELLAVLNTKGRGWGDASSSSEPVAASYEQCLFLPPRPQDSSQRQSTEKNPPEETFTFDQRDAIAEQIRAQAAKERASKAVVKEDLPSTKTTGSTLKRGGAAIATQPQEQRENKDPLLDHGGDKVTVFQPMPPPASSPRSPAKPQPASITYSSSQQPHQFRQR